MAPQTMFSQKRRGRSEASLGVVFDVDDGLEGRAVATLVLLSLFEQWMILSDEVGPALVLLLSLFEHGKASDSR